MAYKLSMNISSQLRLRNTVIHLVTLYGSFLKMYVLINSYLKIGQIVLQ